MWLDFLTTADIVHIQLGRGLHRLPLQVHHQTGAMAERAGQSAAQCDCTEDGLVPPLPILQPKQ